MTTEQHPITPPSPELVEQWIKEPGGLNAVHVATQASRWGANQELEACCQALFDRYVIIPTCIPPKVAEEMRDWLRAARRPKPPSLAEQALAAIEGDFNTVGDRSDIIRRALERLQELEKGNE